MVFPHALYIMHKAPRVLHFSAFHYTCIKHMEIWQREVMKMYTYTVIPPLGVVLLVYAPTSPRARSAQGGRAY